MRFSPASSKAGMPDFEFWALGVIRVQLINMNLLGTIGMFYGHFLSLVMIFFTGDVEFFYFLFFDYRELIKIFN